MKLYSYLLTRFAKSVFWSIVSSILSEVVPSLKHQVINSTTTGVDIKYVERHADLYLETLSGSEVDVILQITNNSEAKPLVHKCSGCLTIGWH